MASPTLRLTACYVLKAPSLWDAFTAEEIQTTVGFPPADLVYVVRGDSARGTKDF